MSKNRWVVWLVAKRHDAFGTVYSNNMLCILLVWVPDVLGLSDRLGVLRLQKM